MTSAQQMYCFCQTPRQKTETLFDGNEHTTIIIYNKLLQWLSYSFQIRLMFQILPIGAQCFLKWAPVSPLWTPMSPFDPSEPFWALEGQFSICIPIFIVALPRSKVMQCYFSSFFFLKNIFQLVFLKAMRLVVT